MRQMNLITETVNHYSWLGDKDAPSDSVEYAYYMINQISCDLNVAEIDLRGVQGTLLFFHKHRMWARMPNGKGGVFESFKEWVEGKKHVGLNENYKSIIYLLVRTDIPISACTLQDIQDEFRKTAAKMDFNDVVTLEERFVGEIEDAKEHPVGAWGNPNLNQRDDGGRFEANESKVDNVNFGMDKPPSKGGNSKSYHLRRLSRDAADPAKSKMYADIMTDLESGVIPSVHQAAIKAGYIREKTRVEQMQSLWKKMTEAEREESSFVKR